MEGTYLGMLFTCLLGLRKFRYIAVTHGAHVQVWVTPNHLVREFAPFVLHRTYTGHHDDVVSIGWSPDSKYAFSAFSFQF